MWGGDSMWGGILCGWNYMWGGVLCGWNFMWGGILCGVEFHSKWGGMSKIVILYEFFPFSEVLAGKRIAPLKSSMDDGYETLTMLGYFPALTWSCIKSRNLAGDTWTLNVSGRQSFF